MAPAYRNDVSSRPVSSSSGSLPVGAPPPEPTREAAAQFAGLLFESAFRPLAATLGFYGDTVVANVARSLAEHERGGLTDCLTRALMDAGR